MFLAFIDGFDDFCNVYSTGIKEINFFLCTNFLGVYIWIDGVRYVLCNLFVCKTEFFPL